MSKAKEKEEYNRPFYDRLIDLYIEKKIDYYLKPKERKANLKPCAKCDQIFIVKKGIANLCPRCRVAAQTSNSHKRYSKMKIAS